MGKTSTTFDIIVNYYNRPGLCRKKHDEKRKIDDDKTN